MVAAGLPRLYRLRLWLVERLLRNERNTMLLAAAAIGVLGAGAAWLFAAAVEIVQVALTAHSGAPETIAGQLVWWQRLLVPTVGGALAGFTLVLGQRLARGQSSTDYMEAIVVGDGTIPTRPTLAKSVASLLSIASGGSVGREGSVVQLSAWAASLAARPGHGAARRQLLVACGAAAGISAVYNAPLAGAIFVGEIVLRTIAIESLGPLLVAAVTASVVSRSVLGAEPMFGQPDVSLGSAWELPAYVGLGVVAGLVAPLVLFTLDAARRGFARLTVPLPARLALGGLVVGAISIAVPAVWGNGGAEVRSLLHEVRPVGLLALLLVAKLVATAATTGSGAVGGVFTPTLLMGAALGGVWGGCLQRLWPTTITDAGGYALVGMAALLAATTHAPLMAIVMAFEMTLDYQIILPLMLACVIASSVAHGLGATPIYDLGGKRRARERAAGAPGRTIDSLLQREVPTIALSAPFSQVVQAFLGARLNHLFVVDGGGRFAGAIALHDIKPHLGAGDLDTLVLAADLVSPIPSVTPGASVTEALDQLSRHQGNRLPVVDPAGRLIGCVHKLDLHLAFAANTGETR